MRPPTKTTGKIKLAQAGGIHLRGEGVGSMVLNGRFSPQPEEVQLSPMRGKGEGEWPVTMQGQTTGPRFRVKLMTSEGLGGKWGPGPLAKGHRGQMSLHLG